MAELVLKCSRNISEQTHLRVNIKRVNTNSFRRANIFYEGNKLIHSILILELTQLLIAAEIHI